MERIIFGFILGLSIGSFLDCIANRSLTKNSFFGRSFCDHCHQTLPLISLIPVISFLLQRGKCRDCRHRISPESTLVEIITGLITAVVLFMDIPADFLYIGWAMQLTIGLDTVIKLFAIYVFLAVFITDIKSGLIPDRITYPSIIIAAVLLIVSAGVKIGLFFLALKSSPLGQYLLPPESDYFIRHSLYILEPLGLALLSSLGVGLFFLVLILLTSGRGMGGGDMKLGFFIGLVLGFPNSVAALMLSFLLGSIFGIGLIVTRIKKFGQTIPFGPFLSLASIAVILWGNQIVNWYLNFRLF